MINYDKWIDAQKHERGHHIEKVNDLSLNSEYYTKRYKIYFNLTGVNLNLNGKSVIEVGAGKISGLYFCENYSQSYIIEPLLFEETLEINKLKNIILINEPIETCELPKVNQVWMFNLLQHVMDPTLVIEKIKKCSDVIYFFEPINYPMNECHLHTLTEDFFVNSFDRESVKYYKKNEISEFFQSECVYGKFIINKNNGKR